MDKTIEDEALRLISKFAYDPKEVLAPNSMRLISGKRVKEDIFRDYVRRGPSQLTSGFRTDPMSFYRELSESFVVYFKDVICWLWVSGNTKLSEKFIEHNLDKVRWHNMMGGQYFTESFLDRYIDKWGDNTQHWVNLIYSYKTKLPPEFYLKHLDKIADSIILDDYCYRKMFPNTVIARRLELLKKQENEE
jgi:hypothetical protein